MAGRIHLFVLALAYAASSVDAFVVPSTGPSQMAFSRDVQARTATSLMATEEKAGPMVSGEELEIMLTEWDEPLIVDAYATWCGPCQQVAPEFEAAAEELKGRVRFVKLDTDEEPDMADRLKVMGLPTLMYLGKVEPEEGSDETARAVLKVRIEGTLRKESIIALAEHHFFGGPKPETLLPV